MINIKINSNIDVDDDDGDPVNDFKSVILYLGVNLAY